jgi:hypothetical protein
MKEALTKEIVDNLTAELFIHNLIKVSDIKSVKAIIERILKDRLDNETI